MIYPKCRQDPLISWVKWGYRKYAQFGLCFPNPPLGNPVKQPVSVRIETGTLYRSDCQNTVDLHLSKSPPIALKLRWILPPNLPHPNPGKAAGMRIWGSFFPGSKKIGQFLGYFTQYLSSPSVGSDSQLGQTPHLMLRSLAVSWPIILHQETDWQQPNIHHRLKGPWC
jgi:hypothetical protein